MQMHDLPPLVTEGVHFRNTIPERLYLDSDPEFHLSMHISISYLLLFHIENRWLTILRRLIGIFLLWTLIGAMFFVNFIYYPFLLEVPVISLQNLLFAHVYDTIFDRDDNNLTMYYISFGMPIVMTVLTMVLLFPIIMRKDAIAKTLLCDGNARFLGDPFPEELTPKRQLQRKPKPSVTVSHEVHLFNNIYGRIRNLGKVQFWKLWWERWVLKPFHCESDQHSSASGKISVLVFAFTDTKTLCRSYFCVLLPWGPLQQTLRW